MDDVLITSTYRILEAIKKLDYSVCMLCGLVPDINQDQLAKRLTNHAKEYRFPQSGDVESIDAGPVRWSSKRWFESIRSHYFSVLFGQLEKEETYTAGSIANLAEKSGFLVGADQKKWVRLYINGLITRHKMPKDETKLVRVQGHPAIPGVMGKHFKAVYIEKLPFLL